MTSGVVKCELAPVAVLVSFVTKTLHLATKTRHANVVFAAECRTFIVQLLERVMSTKKHSAASHRVVLCCVAFLTMMCHDRAPLLSLCSGISLKSFPPTLAIVAIGDASMKLRTLVSHSCLCL